MTPIFINSVILLMDDDNIHPVFFILLIVTVILYSRYQESSFPKKGRKGQPLPSKNVIEAINSIWDNKEFIEQLRYILYDEGSFEDMINKISYRYYDGALWEEINSKRYKPHKVTDSIVNKIYKTKQFETQIDKFKLDDEEIIFFKNLFIYIVCKDNFKEAARLHIFKESEIKTDIDPLKIRSSDYALKINPWELLGPTSPPS